MTSAASVFIILISAGLLLCNVLWLRYYIQGHQNAPCFQGPLAWGNKSNLSAESRHQDYQKVQGSGLEAVPYPIPIPNDTVLLGTDETGRESNGSNRFLTIGISSVWRKEDYLFKTITSILKNSSRKDKEDILILLLVADADPSLRIKRASNIEKHFTEALDKGMLRVIQPPSVLYPSIDFANIRRTYNDPIARVQWRTKQVLDFAFLYWYAWSKQVSKYFLILEDDVLCAKHFIPAIRDFIALHRSHHWIALQLSSFLGIGQLMRCQDMNRLVMFLLLFYKEHPVDILFNHWVSLMAPERPPKNRPYRRVPGLFQHIGIHSTLANKTQPLKDKSFSLVKRVFSHVNPTADIVTTIKQYKLYLPELAYGSAPGLFWGMPNPGDTYDVIFPEPIVITRIVVFTGVLSVKNVIRDRLNHGFLEVAPLFDKMDTPNRATCNGFSIIGEFQNGKVDNSRIRPLFPQGIQCIRITVGKKQTAWVSISEIAVFTPEVEDEKEDQINLEIQGTSTPILNKKHQEKNVNLKFAVPD